MLSLINFDDFTLLYFTFFFFSLSFCSDPLGLIPRGWEQGAVQVTNCRVALGLPVKLNTFHNCTGVNLQPQIAQG